MTEKRDIKKHFEAILSRQLDIDLDGEIVVRAPVGIFTSALEGFVTSREIGTTGPPTKACSNTTVLDVSGTARTGTEGTIKFLLSDFLCGESAYHHPVNFVATPQSHSPVYLTSVQTLTSDWRDVMITVHAWDTTGAPAPNTSFDWRCCIPKSVIIE